MKLVTMVYDSGVDELVCERVDALGLPGYTKLFGAHGIGGQGKKSGDQVWPGENNVLLMAMEDDLVEPLRHLMRSLQEGFRLKPGITIMVSPVEVLP
ncbi:MAG TPA: hypothetical protein VGN26_02580 [Armatimonadota bacterium]|jgi:hypothetical protein